MIVGVNRFADEDTGERIEIHHLDAAIEEAQCRRTAAIRARRDSGAVEAAIAEVVRVAGTDENLLPPLREALRSRCTVGELCGALRSVWGTYDP